MRIAPYWLPLAVLAVGQAIAQPPAPTPAEPPPGGRGRDPWVFRCIFEDRTRMVILAPAPGVWIAFNPATGAIQKAWQGEMVLRGKVWDFSQDNSIAKGDALLSRPSELARLPDSEGNLSGWTVTSATLDGGGWRFDGPDALIVSPSFDTEGFTRLFVAFDEKSRKGPIRVELSNPVVVEVFNGLELWDAQWFDSTTHGSRNDEWQWNFKQISPELTGALRVRFRQTGDFAKRMKDVRVFGDQIAWWAGPEGKPGVPAHVEWLGYELVNQTDGAILKFSVGDGHAAARVALRVDGKAVERYTEAVDRSNDRYDAEWKRVIPAHIELRERYEVKDLPPGVELRLKLPAVAPGGTRSCWTEGAIRREGEAEILVIARDGTFELVTWITTKEAGK